MTPPPPIERRPVARFAAIFAGFAASVVLYTLAFPNFLVEKGIGFLGWVALCPLFSIIPELKPRAGIGIGAAFGVLVYALSDYWLWTYHPAALLIACAYAAFGLAILVPILSFVSKAFPRAYPIAFPFLWLSYEFLRSRGFMGYPYGVLGYAFWRNTDILGLASAGGVWLVSLAALGANSALGVAVRRAVHHGDRFRWGKPVIVPLSIAAGTIIVATIGGAFMKTEYSSASRLRAALIQPNYRNRQRSIQDYNAMSDRLIRGTERALREKPDLIVWHETSIVPPLGWHLRFRTNRETLDLALRMDAYIRGLKVPLLFGNGRAESTGNAPLPRKNWNSAFLYKDGKELGRYDKMRLVPYSETFPAAEKLPKIAARIEAEVGQFWEKGQNLTVFRLGDVGFSAPICFEDSFGDHDRAFAEAGADFLVVLTDDSWGRAASCQYQHLSQSALRAAELGIPVARAANTGATVLLGPDGGILSELPPFTEGFLLAEIPIPPKSFSGTLYRKIGDSVGWAALLASLAWIILSALACKFWRGTKVRPERNTRGSS